MLLAPTRWQVEKPRPNAGRLLAGRRRCLGRATPGEREESQQKKEHDRHWARGPRIRDALWHGRVSQCRRLSCFRGGYDEKKASFWFSILPMGHTFSSALSTNSTSLWVMDEHNAVIPKACRGWTMQCPLPLHTEAAPSSSRGEPDHSRIGCGH